MKTSRQRPTTMWRKRLSGESGAIELVDDAALMPEVGSVPGRSWQSRRSERRRPTGVDGADGRKGLFAFDRVL